MATLPTPEEIMGHLRGVVDPELGSNIVELGMAKSAQISDDGAVLLTIALTTAGCPLRAQIQRDVRERITTLPGVTSVKINWGELSAEEKSTAMATARRNIAENAPVTALGPTTRVIMVASGKGGVGKSSVTVNLAAAMAARGLTIGLIDADIWGFSVPRMLGVEGRLGGDESSGRIRPNEIAIGDGSIRVVSMGLLVDNEETALMWRGLILQRAVRHFLEDVDWGDDLDYVLIDMPPGTGDVQMGLAKLLPRAEMLVVTTPSLSAQKVAVRAVNMGRQNYLRVLGVVENMSYFESPTGERFEIFGSGGGERLAQEAGVPLVGQIPIESAVAYGGDHGEPVALSTGVAAQAFAELAKLLVEELAPPADMSGCSARLLDAVNAALSTHDAQVSIASRHTPAASLN